MNLSSMSASQQRKQIAFRNILNHCSTHDYETTWRQIRKAGNTSLYTQIPEYSQWIAAPDSETLVLVAKLGYGKSVSLANIVDDLSLRIDPGVNGVAYFFYRHDLPDSLIARTVIGALVRQIITPFRNSPMNLRSETLLVYPSFSVSCVTLSLVITLYILSLTAWICVLPKKRKRSQNIWKL